MTGLARTFLHRSCRVVSGHGAIAAATTPTLAGTTFGGPGARWNPQRWHLWLLAVVSTTGFLVGTYPQASTGSASRDAVLGKPTTASVASGSIDVVIVAASPVVPVVVMMCVAVKMSRRRRLGSNAFEGAFELEDRVFVESVENFDGGHVVTDLVSAAGAGDHSRHVRVVGAPGDRHLGGGSTETLGDGGQLLDSLVRSRVGEPVTQPLVARKGGPGSFRDPVAVLAGEQP